ncbi:MAG TPA: FtsX-like permease family protein [Dongiaceae bacterium]|nr:FtsX-like permease family protein [Dongiaceae bacterium]
MKASLIYLKLGLRNILKNRRRSLVTLFSLAAGFSAIALFTGYTSYMYQGLSLFAISGEMLGHLTIAKKGYALGAQMDPERYYFSHDELERLTKALEADSNVDFVSPRISIQGLFSNGTASVVFIGEGIVAEHVNKVRAAIAATSDLPMPPLKMSNDSSAVVASDLARIMGVKPGDTAVLFASSLAGMANAVDIEVADVVNTGAQATNDKYLLVPFHHAQSLLDTDGASRVQVMLKDPTEIDLHRTDVAKRLSDAGLDVDVNTWIEMSNSYQPIRNLFNMIFLFIFGIVLTISITSVVNTMGMVVVERTREIGTLRALGMHRSQVINLFSTEGMLLALLGGLIGSAVSVVVANLVNGLNMSYKPPNFSDQVPLQVDIQAPQLMMIFVFFLLLGTLAALIPAWNASKRRIVDALGHV